MIGDTAWELLHRLTLDEIEHYFQVRATQGFNMIWANLLPEFDGLTTPNRYGHVPLPEMDPTRPSEPYFKFVDEVVKSAERNGLYVGLLPAWGDKLTAPWGAGPRIFDLGNLEMAKAYSAWIGNRYSEFTNVMWVLGGDRPPKPFGPEDQFPMRNALEAGISPSTDWTPIWHSMAEGLRASGASQITTYHPQGGMVSTSHFLHAEDWLDLNAIQSGHGGGHDLPIWEAIAKDYDLRPVKPTFDAEPNYEDSPVSPWPVWDPASGFFDDYDVRKQIYRSIFAGGCGVIYGNHCVWQFASELYEPILEVRYDWKEAIHRPGATAMRHLSALAKRIDLLTMAPSQSRIIGDPGSRGTHARAMGSDRETLVFVPDNRPIEIDLGWALGRKVTVEEIDPSTGVLVTPPTACSEERCSLICESTTDKDRVILIQCALT